MSLADFKSKYLREGETEVGITSVRFFSYNSGSRGVEFSVSAGNGATGKVSFCLVQTALWKLAWFAECCGMSTDDMRKIDPPGEQGFNAFMGRRFLAICEKKPYEKDGETKNATEITDWLPSGSPTFARPATPKPKPQPPAPPVPDFNQAVDDGVPF